MVPCVHTKLNELYNVLAKEKSANKIIIRRTPKKCFQGIEKCPRSSKYRGVSKNGTKWQVSGFKLLL